MHIYSPSPVFVTQHIVLSDLSQLYESSRISQNNLVSSKFLGQLSAAKVQQQKPSFSEPLEH